MLAHGPSMRQDRRLAASRQRPGTTAGLALHKDGVTRLTGMSQKRADEDAAFAIVGKVLDVAVEPYDLGGRQNAVDALLHYPGGQEAALEGQRYEN
jgi:hypothetical protein